MMDWIINLDAGILLFIQETIRNPVLTPLFAAVTVLGNAAVVWILISLGMSASRKTRKTALMCAVALLVSLLINNMVLKNIVGRIRPYEAIAGLVPLIGKPRDYSFPSGHTASSFAAAWVLFRRLPRRFGIPALMLAGLIGISRLYLGVHYPTDVLFGVISGIGCGCAACALVSAPARGKRHAKT
ncbi:phosphatase PAP2 family protein [Acetatifactor aquisgranensis]|uniref:phosphatase PAP2 family protein n=1 Tax=Acetatifactor aquisgranensis TaxID=2941233 RepID=UPI00203C39E1|nr:phosphatase PAP2 family protein [Acetatifactor aquisgranensis]